MATANILVIEDDGDILELVTYNLHREGYSVKTATSGEDGFRIARSDLPNLVILDLMLPGADGLEICRLIRGDSKTRHIPVMMLTAKGEDADIVAGLELGADDYITKPFSPRVLTARVRALLRRKPAETKSDQTTLKIRDLVINPGRHEVLLSGKPLTLTATEFQLLNLMARHPGWVYTRDQLINEIRGEDAVITDRSVDVQIVGLRKKLGHASDYIETVRGVGYRFRE
ncbi:MAG: response regulator transcription factor [Candidatus Zixiibacteriota bacterium]